MAKLFKDKSIKRNLEKFEIPNFESKLNIVKKWLEAYKSKTLHQKTESQCEQAFNQSFFVELLGYKTFPNEVYNLEPKGHTEATGQKPDAVLGYFSNEKTRTIAVVEIKDVNTSLDRSQKREGNLSPVQQAFKYKPQYKECDFVIATNFFEIRLHKDTQLDYEQFTLESLANPKDNYYELRKFYYLLSAENFVTKTGKSETETLLSEIRIDQETITKNFYKEYKLLRQELIKDIVKNNSIPKSEFALTIEKAQKLIDRVVFVCFCEDEDLLPDGILFKVIEAAESGFSSVWETMKGFFKAIDKGSEKLGIPNGYNGGLFAEDSILDQLKLSDSVLKKFLEFGKYDFSEDLSVNILGHIFEQSISDIEAIKSKTIDGEELDKKKSKRKKDGIFYTPDYIVDYIVKNALGKYLEEKETEIKEKNNLKEDINDTNYKKRALATYIEYQTVLREVKVLDPACGSGAFLVKVFDYLLEENKRVANIIADLNDDKTDLFSSEDYIKSLLENNIYGVDLNPESVEITKLSLWLKSAQRGKKLVNLNNNIKCGNSLIDDPAVAGNRAFNWEKEFSSIFPEKEMQAFLVTWVTHNSRISERMVEYGVQTGEPVVLDSESERLVAQSISNIIRSDQLRVPAFNICRDHVHMVLVCAPEELTGIVQKLKSISAREHNVAKGWTIPEEDITSTATRGHSDATRGHSDATRGHDPLFGEECHEDEKQRPRKGLTQKHLWAQKFHHRVIEDEAYLENALHYVKHNREKHDLPHDEKLQKIIDSMSCTLDEAFAPSYAGGFDVVVGNPPYVRQELLGDYKDYFSKRFEVYEGASDLFAYFYEQSFRLLKSSGVFAFISNTFDKTKAAIKLRSYLGSKIRFQKYVDFTDVQIFEGATTYPIIFVAKKNEPLKNQFDYIKIPKSINATSVDIDALPSIKVTQNSLAFESWSFHSANSNHLLKKITNHKTIREMFGKCYRGIITGFNEAFIIQSTLPISDHVKYIYEGKEIKKWFTPTPQQKIIFFESKWTKNNYGENLNEDEALEKVKKDYPELINHLLPFEESAKKRYDKGEYWWEMRNCAYYDLFEKPKIIFPNLQNSNKFSLDEKGVFINAPAVFLPSSSKPLLCILNSKLVWFFLKSICVVRSGGYIEVKPQYFEQIPIPDYNSKSGEFERKADLMLSLNKTFHEKLQAFLKLIQTEYNLPKISKKLEKFYTLEFEDFLKELKAAKLNLDQKADLLAFFEKNKKELLELKQQIDSTDHQIDEMVFDLYGLTEEERQIVLNN